ncbi:MAG: hypothetical protein AAGB23_01925 [Pseudomonadota bacterium]
MRIVALVLAPLTALAACDDPSTTGDTEDSIPPIPFQMGPGLYAVGDETTIYSRTRLSVDGTYVDLDEAMEPVGGGTWEQRGEEMCFDPAGDGEDQQERCWTNSEPGEDGSFMSTRVDGEGSYRVTPLER